MATQPAAAPARILLIPSSFYLILRKVHLTIFRTKAIAGRKRAIVKYSRLRLSAIEEGFLSIILRVRMSCRAKLMTRPYFKFLNACLRAEMMHPQP